VVVLAAAAGGFETGDGLSTWSRISGGYHAAQAYSLHSTQSSFDASCKFLKVVTLPRKSPIIKSPLLVTWMTAGEIDV